MEFIINLSLTPIKPIRWYHQNSLYTAELNSQYKSLAMKYHFL
jgi:hypothetical protein